MGISKEESSDSLINMSKKKEIEEQINKLESEVTCLKEKADALYNQGWNEALSVASHRLEHDFRKAFGPDTLNSIAIYLKGLKK